jgi:hypothetical protein
MKREWKTLALILTIQTAEKDSWEPGKDLVERERAGEFPRAWRPSLVRAGHRELTAVLPPSGLHAHCTMPASLVT